MAGGAFSKAQPCCEFGARARRSQPTRRLARLHCGSTARLSSPKSALTVSLRLGLLRLTEPWELEDEQFPPADPDWRQVAGEGIGALVNAGVA